MPERLSRRGKTLHTQNTRRIGKTVRATSAIAIVEAAYRLDGSEAEWLDAILEHIRADLDTGAGVYGFTGNEAAPNFAEGPVFVHHDVAPEILARLGGLNATVPKELFAALRNLAGRRSRGAFLRPRRHVCPLTGGQQHEMLFSPCLALHIRAAGIVGPLRTLEITSPVRGRRGVPPRLVE